MAVVANGTFQYDFWGATFVDVERLIVEDFGFLTATIDQLNAFQTITTSYSNTLLRFIAVGQGGSIDFSTRITEPGIRFRFDASSVASAVDVTGTLGDDSLTGSAYRDILRGGTGNDQYVVDAADLVIETASGAAGGIDTIYANGTYDLANAARVQGEIENLTLSPFLTPPGQTGNLYGNALDNVITGNASDNILDGRAGVDTLIGGFGNDRYVVDNARDRVIDVDNLSDGSDTVIASVSFTLEARQGVEMLKLDPATGSAALNLTGNEYDQMLVGNAGANILNGSGGRDIANYAPSDAAVTIALDGSLGTGGAAQGDRLIEIEGVLGSRFNDNLTGNAGVNWLDGGLGADVLTGLSGVDHYRVDNALDQVIEAADQGSDVALSTVSYRLQAEQSVERLETVNLSGTTNLDLTGNEFGQTITGNAGNNALNGGGGADTMRGFAGSDLYVVDNAGDLVFEGGGEGIDTVFASTSWALGAGQSVEAIRTNSQAGTTAINLTGNELAQSLYGNAGDNVINGRGGLDTLNGFGGNDTFVFETGLGGADRIRIGDFSSADDTIQLDRSVFSALGLGTLNPGAYKDIASGTADADDRILYDHDSGSLYYDTNGSAAGERYLIATLDNKPATLTNADFFVVA